MNLLSVSRGSSGSDGGAAGPSGRRQGGGTANRGGAHSREAFAQLQAPVSAANSPQKEARTCSSSDDAQQPEQSPPMAGGRGSLHSGAGEERQPSGGGARHGGGAERERFARAEAHHGAGYAMRKGGDFRGAVEEYTAALALAPGHFKALFNRGFSHDKVCTAFAAARHTL